MKNIIARGGIEFLAVLLGISGSLWLDDRSTYTQERKYEIEAYQRLSNALTLDIEGLVKASFDQEAEKGDHERGTLKPKEAQKI